ncbi:MAG: DUF1841 family protein [Nitrospinota bacterium]|nr:DUF1841 family protein [Nitrospinota bacterium]
MLTFDKESQTRILRVAGERSEGKAVNDEDQPIVKIMDLHSEFDDLWLQGELASYPQEINGSVVNPFVHTVLHCIIDWQITNEDPIYVTETKERLIGQGMDEHECLHTIIKEYAEVYFKNFRNGRGFDHLDYQSRLNQLSYIMDG